MPSDAIDPIRDAAALISGAPNATLERRLKQDIMDSIARLKPLLVADVDFEQDVMTGRIFPNLSAPLQGIAIAKTEGAIAFYNRVGWNPAFLEAPLSSCIDEATEGSDLLTRRYGAKTLHDLCYVHPRHFEKMFGKAGAVQLWEDLKRLSSLLS